ncbi:uncharacterized protein [Arachis hypogaea]|uniref:uncharacterized protein n=1 Tax=Arachis hypogaea TaxID=3818 RepID=UPI000DEC15B6|nr:uncharacterized protein LOC112734161 [Arachis hypogaea]
MKLSSNILQPSTGDLVGFSGATYQRLMDKVFAKQIGRNIEVYVDDMVAKTKIGNNHLDDLTEIFSQIRKYNMRLNPEKCALASRAANSSASCSLAENAELRYPSIEKLALALVFSARRLRPYFQSHVIHIRTDHPLRQVLQKPELAGQLVKWSVELSDFDIRYQGQSSIKSQFLADFIAEFTILDIAEYSPEWSLYVDGSSNPQGCGAGIILDDENGNVIEHSLHFFFKASYNQSEYEALITGLRLASYLNIAELKVYYDSLLIVQQVNELYQENNSRADILSKLANTQINNSSLHRSTLIKPSIELTDVLSVTQEADWRTSYINYLRTGILPGNVENVRHFCRQASFFTIYNNCLYRRGFSRPLLKCLCRTEAELALAEAHEGICEHPQTNGLAEAKNKVILHALRKKLDDTKGLWAELIPEIIWGYNTTIHSTTKETPLRLVYGSDAMIPVEISQSSLRTEMADHTTKETARQFELDLLEEVISSTTIKQLVMQQHIARRYNQRLHPRSFQVNNIVLRKAEQARRPSSHGKLAANWEGPYRIIEVIGNGAYRLQTLDGKDLPNTWNVSSLKLYYS